MSKDQLDHMLSELIGETEAQITKLDREILFDATRDCSLHQVLFSQEDEGILSARMAAWPKFIELSCEIAALKFIRPFVLWKYACAVAQFISAQNGKVFGIAGPAGGGKTTLATLVRNFLRALYPTQRFAQLSLDDFHLPKAVRRIRGIPWRATPGSHDIALAVSVLDKIRQGHTSIQVPHYDASIDDISRTDTIRGPVSVAILDGWFVGRREDGYARIADRVDYLIYLDCPIELAKKRRFARVEARLVGHDKKMQAQLRNVAQVFWDEVQLPGYEEWVKPVQPLADLVINFGFNGTIDHVLRNV